MITRSEYETYSRAPNKNLEPSHKKMHEQGTMKQAGAQFWIFETTTSNKTPRDISTLHDAPHSYKVIGEATEEGLPIR